MARSRQVEQPPVLQKTEGVPMKAFRFLLPLVILVVLFLAGCAASPTSNAVQVPDLLKVAINAFVLVAVTFGLQLVFDKVGLDLRGVGVVVAASVAEFVILQLQGLIDVVPMAYDLYVTIVLNVILAILTSLGYVRVFLQRERAKELL